MNRMTLDDGAVPVGPGASALSSGFDRSTLQMASALPVTTLQGSFTEVIPTGAGKLVPSESSGCNPDAVTTPALPATEVLATKPPESGAHEAEVAQVAAARATTEVEADGLMSAVAKAAKDCASFSSEPRDLGEGSVMPGEEGTARLADFSQDGWSGVRVTATVSLNGRTWSQTTTREALVVRRGQVVVLVRVTKPEGAQQLVDSLAKETLAGIDALQ